MVLQYFLPAAASMYGAWSANKAQERQAKLMRDLAMMQQQASKELYDKEREREEIKKSKSLDAYDFLKGRRKETDDLVSKLIGKYDEDVKPYMEKQMLALNDPAKYWEYIKDTTANSPQMGKAREKAMETNDGMRARANASGMLPGSVLDGLINNASTKLFEEGMMGANDVMDNKQKSQLQNLLGKLERDIGGARGKYKDEAEDILSRLGIEIGSSDALSNLARERFSGDNEINQRRAGIESADIARKSQFKQAMLKELGPLIYGKESDPSQEMLDLLMEKELSSNPDILKRFQKLRDTRKGSDWNLLDWAKKKWDLLGKVRNEGVGEKKS